MRIDREWTVFDDFFDALKGLGLTCVYELWERPSEVLDISGRSTGGGDPRQYKRAEVEAVIKVKINQGGHRREEPRYNTGGRKQRRL